tara:strand:- start:12448 stop:13218 length:771 start_codon:yes stop_codon:yes gene_type:complete
MIFLRLIFFFFVLVFIESCVNPNYSPNIKKRSEKSEKIYYNSKGFALIYSDLIYDQGVINKRVKNDKFEALHSYLRRNTTIKIINPDNSKVVEVKVAKKANYPKLFNIVISKSIADTLELDSKNPYVEVIELKKNKTFVAKKSNTFDEEKNVAEKAPVEEIQMSDLSKKDEKSKNSNQELKKNFMILVSDFYYQDSANNLKNELIEKTKNNNFLVKKISNNKYRLSVGPFKNFHSLKTTYISLNNLGFEALNVYKD